MWYIWYNGDMGKWNFKSVFYYIILIVICQVGVGLMGGGGEVFAGVNDFHFSDFTGDYYLSKDEEGVSRLKVKESLTAVFPNTNQNKGICRQIPFTNQGGINTTLPKLTRDNIKVTRNGETEPIYSIDRRGDYYEVCTGTDEYVLGEQTYIFEYDFVKVVTDYGTYQELYWDTNGTGWGQRFDSVKARLHFEDKSVWTGDTWCYEGAYGKNERDRCTTTKISDGVEFSAKKLKAYENLTFDAELLPGSFVVPEPDKDYTMIIAAVVVIAGCVTFLIYKTIKYKATADKIKEYKEIFVAPQYQPHTDYDLAEMAEIYLGKKKDVKVGILLDMIVKKKVELHKKGDEGIDIKHKWALVVKDTNIREEGMILLEILADKLIIKEGDVIELEARTATKTLMELGKQFDRVVLEDVKQDSLVENDYKIGDAKPLGAVGGAISALFTAALVVFVVLAAVLGLTDYAIIGAQAGKDVVGRELAIILMIVSVTITLAAVFWMNGRTRIMKNITAKGMKASKYMEGLKLYIEMVEAERIKMLQSTKGADTSPEGIVKLYEKLLPYAAVFGLEESWMKEMKDYCELEEVETPDYLMTGITTSQLSRAMRSSASYASSAGHTIAGGGSYSLSSSGGGGGGFSGGGGGGGGGGGR